MNSALAMQLGLIALPWPPLTPHPDKEHCSNLASLFLDSRNSGTMTLSQML
jgi:hypothetical protein